MSSIVNQSIWKNKSFVKMFIAYSISILGDWFDMIAVSVLIAYTWDSSPIIVGLIPVMYALPGVLFSSIAGVAADKWNKLNIMVIADLMSSLLTFVLFFSPNIYWVLPVLLLRASFGLFNTPAQQSLTRHVVSENHLLKAASLNGIINQTAKIAGPLIGGIVLVIISPQLLILINGISSIISASILLTLQGIKEDKVEESEHGQKTSFKVEWIEGWRVIFDKRVLLYTFIFSFIGLLSIQLVDFQFAVFFREFAPNKPALLGWVIASLGVGAVIGITLIGRLKNIRYGLSLGINSILIGIGFGGIGILKPGMHILLPIVFGFIAGIGNGSWMVTVQYLLQKETPKKFVGRVFGIQNMLFSSVMLVSPVTGGVLVKIMGVSQIFKIVGMTVISLGMVAILFNKWLWDKEESKILTAKSTSIH